MSKKNKQKDNRKSAARKNNNLNKKDALKKQEDVQANESEEKTTSIAEDIAAKFNISVSHVALIAYGLLFLFTYWLGMMEVENPIEPVTETILKITEVFLNLTLMAGYFFLSLGIFSIIDKKIKDRKEKKNKQ